MNMQSNLYIIKFPSFDRRAEWLQKQSSNVNRVYKLNSWCVAELDKSQIAELESIGAQVFPDVILTPGESKK